MFDVDFKLKNETDFTIKVFTMIEGEYAPAVMILKPNEEMLHFKPSIGEISISVMAKRSSEIERLRDALQKIKKRNPFHNVSPPMDKQYYAQIITEMVGIANAALKEDE